MEMTICVGKEGEQENAQIFHPFPYIF